MTPTVSVLMPIYDGERFLNDAISSVLNQTFEDFEFIIINDGSNDETQSIITSFNDSRIKLLNNGKNLGLIKSLNIGLDNCRGEYIARLDCDDLMYSNRIESQVNYMNNNKKVSVVGSYFHIIDEKNNIFEKFDWPIGLENNLFHLITGRIPVGHPGVLMRKETIMKLGGYRNKFIHCEDLDLWLRLYLNGYVLDNIPEYLTMYRRHSNQISIKKYDIQFNNHILSFYDFYKTATDHNIKLEKITSYLNLFSGEKNIISDRNIKNILNIYINLILAMHDLHKTNIDVKKIFNMLFYNYKKNISIINQLKYLIKKYQINNYKS